MKNLNYNFVKVEKIKRCSQQMGKDVTRCISGYLYIRNVWTIRKRVLLSTVKINHNRGVNV